VCYSYSKKIQRRKNDDFDCVPRNISDVISTLNKDYEHPLVGVNLAEILGALTSLPLHFPSPPFSLSSHSFLPSRGLGSAVSSPSGSARRILVHGKVKIRLYIWSRIHRIPLCEYIVQEYKQESRAVARKPRDATAVLFSLKFADNVHSRVSLRLAKLRKPDSELQTYRRKTIPHTANQVQNSKSLHVLFLF